jgi:hypothetical protein
MHINATVIIQIINFIVAHAFLSRFLLQPLADRVLKKRQARARMVINLAKKQKQILALTEQKTVHALAFQHRIAADYSTPPAKLAKLPLLEEPTLQGDTINMLTKKTVEIILKKASHG